jgi:hypothetical protein
MNLYNELFESMIGCFDRVGFRPGLEHTIAMIVLGLGLCLNLLSVVNLLWAIGVLHDPYGSHGGVHPRHYVYALLCGGFIVSTILARVNFNADCPNRHPQMQTAHVSMPNHSLLNMRGPTYILGSTVLFLVILTWDLLNRG